MPVRTVKNEALQYDDLRVYMPIGENLSLKDLLKRAVYKNAERERERERLRSLFDF